MKYLENKEILSDKIFYTMKTIAEQCPNVIFGGSIALNAVGLLNRKIGDIDTFFGEIESLERNGFLKTRTLCFSFSYSLSDDEGNTVQRTGVIINHVHVCVFKVDKSQLQYSLMNIRGTVFKIQNVNCAIQAKLQYSKRGVQKHIQDLEEITLRLNGENISFLADNNVCKNKKYARTDISKHLKDWQNINKKIDGIF